MVSNETVLGSVAIGGVTAITVAGVLTGHNSTLIVGGIGGILGVLQIVVLRRLKR